MNDPIPFMQPRMVGPRFDGHAIPLEMLKDLAVLEEMVIEVAKWCFRKATGRERSPRGFSKGISLKITDIEDGSAVPNIAVFIENDRNLFPAADLPPPKFTYFEKARESICGAINAAANDENITDYLPENLLSYFDRIGRGLQDGEVIEFDPGNTGRPARLDKSTRRKLVLASKINEHTDEVVLRGTVPKIDQASMTFELETNGGSKIVADMGLQQLETVLDATRGYQTGDRVLIQGIGRFDRSGRLKSIEEVEHISILDPLDVAARLEEFYALKDGWLDGKGLAPSREGLDWFANTFESHYPEDLPLPYLYPTGEGGIQAEWALGGYEISLEVDLGSKRAAWQDLNMATDAEQDRNLNLTEAADWNWMVEQIRTLSAEGGA